MLFLPLLHPKLPLKKRGKLLFQGRHFCIYGKLEEQDYPFQIYVIQVLKEEKLHSIFDFKNLFAIIEGHGSFYSKSRGFV